VATHETSLYNEWGEQRKNFGLAELFAADYAGRVEPRMQNSYLSLAHPHPLLKGLEDTPRIINGVARVHTRASRGASPAPISVIPSYPDLPMEDVYPRIAKTDQPGVHINEIGRARVVYFPWDIDRTFWEVLAGDHLKLLANAVSWAFNADQPLSVTGPGVLDVTLWRQKNSITAHLVNLTNPMMMKGPVREIIPLPPQTVRIQLPPGTRPARVHLLVAGNQPAHKVTNGRLELAVPSVVLHEVVAVDLA
jgi:hypothetical protein